MKLDDVAIRLKTAIDSHLKFCQEEALDGLANSYYWAEENCDSDIERIFALAWFLRLERYRVGGSSYGGDAESMAHKRGWTKLDTGEPFAELVAHRDVIIPQFEVGNFRADFAIQRFVRSLRTETVIAGPRVLIECDGHDFHERTKQQAQRDKKRDRVLQMEGYFVLRFTGWEIWHNPASVAAEVEEFIDEHLRRLEPKGN